MLSRGFLIPSKAI